MKFGYPQVAHHVGKVWIAASYVLREYPVLARLFVEYGAGRGKASKEEQLVDLTARFIVGKPFTLEEKAYFLDVVERHGLSPWAIPLSFFRLPNSLERRVLKHLAIERAHLARIRLIQKDLPPAQDILDIGGAVDIHPEGALLALGYPHKPKHIRIVDLPVEDRTHRFRTELKDMQTPSGTHVSYVYTSMTDLSRFESGTFDMVWSGQSIEHVTESDAEIVMREVFRVLKPGGDFCLDTPNRAVTRLVSEQYMHPGHFIEYTPAQLVAKLESAGFETVSTKAVTPLPHSARLGRISKLEILEETRVGDDSNVGFSFFVHCRRPKD